MRNCKSEEIREEIRIKGWRVIERLYSSMNNKDNAQIIPLFDFYKFIFEDMKKKGSI